MSNTRKLIESIQSNLNEGYRDINRIEDEWKLVIDPSVKSINEIKNNYNSMKHNATWYEYSEIKNILDNYEDKETRLKLLNQLKIDIDTNIKYAKDYKEADQEAIDLWLKCYKDYVDEIINKLDLEGKYYIKINLTTYNEIHEDSGRTLYLDVNNGKFEVVYPPKYYDSREEAQKELDSLNKTDIDNYIKNNCLGEFTINYEWDINVYEYKVS